MKKILVSILIILIVICAIFGLIFVSQVSCKPNFQGVKKIKINPGETLEQISEKLFEEKMIHSKFYFKVYLYLYGKQNDIKAGEYNLSPLNIIELSKKLVKGEPKKEINAKIIEGWTLDDIAQSLVKQKIIKDKKEFLNIANTNKFKGSYDFLNNVSSVTDEIRGTSLEGFIFPDTYRVFEDSSADDIINKALKNFEHKVTPAMLTEIKAQGKRLYDVLIMASIIEQEVQIDEDRKIVAGILWKRLDENIKLQVDSSLKYIIGKNDKNFLTYKELESNSPYNTYKFVGLPPTPICNPGISAIRAAIYPKHTDYYFYLTDKNGQTIFSKTGREHLDNVERYLK